MKKTKRSDQLVAKLKRSLKSEGPATESTATQVVDRPGARKFSISLYLPDLERLDAIKAFMQGKGYRNLSDSEALRIACRAVEISDSFLPLYQQMQQEDRRRKSV